MGIIDEDGVGVGYIKAGLDDSGSYQDVIVAPDEVEHNVFYLLALHPAVHNCRFDPRADAADSILNHGDVLNPVIDEEDLTVPAHLIDDSFADYILIEAMKFGNN